MKKPYKPRLVKVLLKPTDVVILSAIFARSNMGMGLPDKERVDSYKKNSRHVSINGAVMAFCEQFMETDEHQKMFEDEASGWQADLSKMTLDGLRKAHPDIADLYYGPVQVPAQTAA